MLQVIDGGNVMASDSGYVLIVDDNADTREILTRLLELHGIEAKSASDGFKGLAAVRETPPSLIITDLMMPEMSGFGFIKELQTDRSLKSIPIVVISATADTQGFDHIPGVIKMFRKGSFNLSELSDLVVDRLKGPRPDPAK